MWNILVPWRFLNGMHRRTAQCKKGADQKRRRLAKEEERAVKSRTLRAYGRSLYMVNSFQYLGQVILAADYD